MNLSKEIASMYDDAVRIRQDLHRIPEIGFQLHDTQAYVLNELRQCAPDRLETPAVCGVKAVFFAKDAQKTWTAFTTTRQTTCPTARSAPAACTAAVTTGT